MECFRKSGVWLKGNLHQHSTVSDGLKSPEEIFEIFSKAGYDFLALTDHWRISSAGKKGKMLIIPGTELNSQYDGKEMTHLVGINIKTLPKGGAGEPIYRHALSESDFTILAHPNWSSLDIGSFPFLNEVDAVEVYNTGCELTLAKGYSEYFWDLALERGNKVFAVAVDDSHQKVKDYCKGFVMVKAKEKAGEDIIASLKRGDYYSSNGPLFKDISLENGRITAKAQKPCREIRFICNKWFGKRNVSPDKNGLMEAAFEPNSEIAYCRVELIDFEGNKAWSNPVHFNNKKGK